MVELGSHIAALTSQPGSASPSSGHAHPPPKAEPGHTTPPARRRGILMQAVERDVIPRLLLARQKQHTSGPAVTFEQIIELTDLTLAPDEEGVSTFVSGLLGRGIPAETLYLDLLTASARRLGVFWVEDVCDFTQVTIGVGRLHKAMRMLEPTFLSQPVVQAGKLAWAGGLAARRVLLAPLPGEQHTFGLSMVAGFFRRAGWSVQAGPVASREELAAFLRAERVGVLGFTLACNEQMEGVRAEIRAAREASCNPELVVLVGGPPFVDHPELAGMVGADGTANDGPGAVAAANSLVSLVAGNRAGEGL